MNTEKITTNFFSVLDKMLNSKNGVVLNILKNAEGEMTIAVTNVVAVDDDKETLPAISISGPVEEIDAEFFGHILKPAAKIKALTVNTAEAEAGIDELKEDQENEKTKAAEKKKTGKSKPVKAAEKKVEPDKKDPKKEAKELATKAHFLFEKKEYKQAVELYVKALALDPKDKNIQEGLKKAQQWEKSVAGLYADKDKQEPDTEEVKETSNIPIVQVDIPPQYVQEEEMTLEIDLMSDDELPI